MTGKMEKDLIIVAQGGAMAGVFGAGVVTAFQRANLYSRISSVYGISAGAHNLAYFLAKQTELGSSIYWEDLSGGKFIKKKNLLPFLKDIFLRCFNKNHRVAVLMDIDYLLKIEQGRKKLNIDVISISPIDYFVKVFDVERKRNVYISCKDFIFEKLKASTAVVPFYSKTVAVDEKDYIDSAASDSLADDDLISIAENNKDKKIIYILNRPLKNMVRLDGFVGNLFWAITLLIYLRDFSLFLNRINVFRRYFAVLNFIKRPNVYFINSEIFILPFCDNKDKLVKLYRHGIQKASDFINQRLA